jgi:hypothetical protein
MSAEKGGGGEPSEGEKHKRKRNWALGISVLAAFVSVPIALFSAGFAGYQHAKIKD